MATKALPSPKLLRKILRYEPETGKLFWRRRPVSMFTSARSAKTWNTRFAGVEAFTYSHKGYRRGLIFYRSFDAHRVIWAIVHGAWPAEIDHINGDSADNRLANLRAVSHAENCRNRRLNINNTSGVTGVYWNKREEKWEASINGLGRFRHLGYFDAFAEAVAARRTAEAKYGFHENHGR